MRRSSAAAGALIAVALRARAEDPPGRLTERIECRGDPAQAYALFLPSGYVSGRGAPVLYLLDARGRALLPIERFREAAERYGWILASSYNSRSDTKGDPNTPAVQAMWNDTHARLTIDSKRTYLGGFSGGARAAAALAARTPAAIAGVVACGAGLPPELPARDFPIPYFGTSGDRDFNYYEMRALDSDLSKARAPHRIAYFDGGHDWPPPETAGRALAWMELSAMRSGARPYDAALVSGLLGGELARAEALEAAGDPAGAHRRYAETAADFRGLADVGPAAAKAEALGNSDAVRQALRDASRRDDRDRASLRRLAEKLRSAARDPDIPAAGALAAELGLPALKARASSPSPEERLSAERLLAHLRVETRFYLPEDLLERKDVAHARLMLELAGRIDPDDPGVDYGLASLEARAGQTRRALRALDRAAEKGFRSFERLEEDPAFASLRADPEFRRWRAQARSATPTPSPP